MWLREGKLRTRCSTVLYRRNMSDDEEAARLRANTLPSQGSKKGTSLTNKSSLHGSLRRPQQSNIPEEKEVEAAPVTRRHRRFRPSCLHMPGLTERRFSRRQSYSITTPCTPGQAPIFPVRYEPLWKPTFFLKLAQLMVTGVCVTLYALALPHSFKNCKVTYEETIGYYMSGAIFPYIVFCAYVIITGMTVLGCLLGQPMPAVLNRAFNLLAVAMFLTSAGVAWHRWLELFSFLEPLEDIQDMEGCTGTPQSTLLVSACLALLCAVLHLVEIIITIQFTIKQINGIAPTPSQQRDIAAAAARKGRVFCSNRISESISSTSAM